MSERNENSPGYIKTKAGWIPDNWRCIPLGDLSFVQTGIAKNNRDILQPVSLPYLRVANVQDGFLDLREIKKISLEEQEVERYLLRSGDVLFTEGGDFDKLGRGAIWNNEVSPCLHQNHVFAVRCKKALLLPLFLSAVASGPHGRKYFLLSSKQSTNLASINSTQLKQFPIPLPPLSEQKTIVDILATWGIAIEQTRKLIDAKKRVKKALMQQLFSGKKRLPDFCEEWKSYDLKDLAKQIARPIEFDDNATYHLISVRRRSGGIFRRGAFAGHDIKTKQMYTAKKGDFLISKVQIVHGASALVEDGFDGMNITGSYIALRVANQRKLDVHFFNWLSKTPYFYHLTFLASYGVHIEKMTFNLRLFLKSKIKIPKIFKSNMQL